MCLCLCIKIATNCINAIGIIVNVLHSLRNDKKKMIKEEDERAERSRVEKKKKTIILSILCYLHFKHIHLTWKSAKYDLFRWCSHSFSFTKTLNSREYDGQMTTATANCIVFVFSCLYSSFVLFFFFLPWIVIRSTRQNHI